MAGDSSKRLENTLRRLLARTRPKLEVKPRPVTPACPFGALVEERMRLIERELEETKGRVNGLLFLLVALVIAEVILSIVG